jgi:hypothetical protein
MLTIEKFFPPQKHIGKFVQLLGQVQRDGTVEVLGIGDPTYDVKQAKVIHFTAENPRHAPETALEDFFWGQAGMTHRSLAAYVAQIQAAVFSDQFKFDGEAGRYVFNGLVKPPHWDHASVRHLDHWCEKRNIGFHEVDNRLVFWMPRSVDRKGISIDAIRRRVAKDRDAQIAAEKAEKERQRTQAKAKSRPIDIGPGTVPLDED